MDQKQYMREYYQRNRDKMREQGRAHYEANKDEYIARAKKRRLDDPERRKVEANKWRRSDNGVQQSRDWTAQNRDKHNDINRRSKKKHIGRVRAEVRTRQANKINACPAWADKAAIRAIYEACPVGYHVDHIIPLQGDTVCGLHVDYNLQYLTPRENMAKGNKLIAPMASCRVPAVVSVVE